MHTYNSHSHSPPPPPYSQEQVGRYHSSCIRLLRMRWDGWGPLCIEMNLIFSLFFFSCSSCTNNITVTYNLATRRPTPLSPHAHALRILLKSNNKRILKLLRKRDVPTFKRYTPPYLHSPPTSRHSWVGTKHPPWQPRIVSVSNISATHILAVCMKVWVRVCKLLENESYTHACLSINCHSCFHPSRSLFPDLETVRTLSISDHLLSR